MKKIDYMKYTSYQVGYEIVNLISKIHEYKGKEELFSISNPEVLKKLTRIAKIQSTESSNRIEGIFTSNKRLKEIVMDKVEPLNRNESEIAGYRDVLELIHTSNEFIDVTPNVLLQLHKNLYTYSSSNIGGKYKTSDNIIQEEDILGNKKIRFVPVKAYLTEDYIKSLCESYNNVVNNTMLDPLLIIPIFILDFLSIHPFTDGNGRMSRLLTLLLLYKSGYYVGKYIIIEEQIEKSKETYYDVLKLSSDDWHENTNNNDYFIKYYLGVILSAYKQLEERYIITRSLNMTSNERISKYFDESLVPITKKELVNMMADVAQITIERNLNILLKEKYIEKIGQGKSTRYIRRKD